MVLGRRNHHRQLRLQKVFRRRKHQLAKIMVSWRNRTKPDLVLTLLMDWRFRSLSKARFYIEVILKTKDKRAELFDMREFEKALNEEVTVYRGNAGVFNSA